MPRSIGTIDEAKRRLAPRQPLEAWTHPTGPSVRVEEVPMHLTKGEGSSSNCIRVHTTHQSIESGSRVVTARDFADNVPRLESTAFTCPWGDDLPTEPTVLTGCCEYWPAFARDEKQWNVPNLARRAVVTSECDNEQLFSVDGGPGFARESYGEGRVSMPEYARYCNNHAGGDAVPLYIFDHRCLRPRPTGNGNCTEDSSTSATPIDSSINLFDDYRIPPSFQRDVMSCLTGTRFRPLPPAWLLVGCARSGTPLHDHPLTVAWNALLSGCKLWAILPPNIDESLLLLTTNEADPNAPNEANSANKHFFASCEPDFDCDNFGNKAGNNDGGNNNDEEVENDNDDDFDLSALDWFGRLHSANVPEETLSQMRVCIQRPGEVVFVPAGWWHVVLNVTDSVCFISCVML